MNEAVLYNYTVSGGRADGFFGLSHDNQRLSRGVFTGGTVRSVQTFDAQGGVKSQQVIPQDISAMAWLGDTLVVGLADGRVVGLKQAQPRSKHRRDHENRGGRVRPGRRPPLCVYPQISRM